MALPDIALQDNNAPVQPISDPLLEAAGVRLSVLRLDLLDPLISGNKWFKLKHNLRQARARGFNRILSFGGPWSNHLHALAEAGKRFGFETVGLVRGELPDPLNPCLLDARRAGMRLVGLERSAFRQCDDAAFLDQLGKQFGPAWIIPEGGANREGILGCRDIGGMLAGQDFDLASLACGSGTTLTGLVSNSCIPVLGFQVLKGKGYLENRVQVLLQVVNMRACQPWSINADYHFGGFARTNTDLHDFMAYFESRSGIPLEPVYSGKMLYGLYNLIKRDFFPRKYSIIAIHGGGLQGARGFAG